MRALSGAKFPDKPADPLIVHPDIRRMLLTQKAFAEGGRVLGYYAAMLVDLVERSADAEERKRADESLSFIIPIVKALLTEASVECTNLALQIYGGHGYIHETGIEQFARDSRITTIYEGTTQIQALDLLGRKILQTQGVGLRHFLEEISAFCHANAHNAALAEFVAPLAIAAKEWADLTQEIGKRALGQSRRDRRGGGRLSVFRGLRRPRLFLGAQRRGGRCDLRERRLQAVQAPDRAFLFRAHPAAHADARRARPRRARQPDGDAGRTIRLTGTLPAPAIS